MLDIGWPELFVVLVIALLVIGPRDLPRAMHHVGRWVKRARAMTAEFQRHFDEMARDSELDELRDMKRKMSARGIKDEVGKAIDPTGEMREAMDVKAGTPLAKPLGAAAKVGNGATSAGAKGNGAAEPTGSRSEASATGSVSPVTTPSGFDAPKTSEPTSQ